MIARLQRLRGQLEEAERDRLLDDERQRIARELHDRVAQTFFGIGLAAQSALDVVDTQSGSPHQRTLLESIRGLSALGNEHMREAIFALSRADVHERGLVPDAVDGGTRLPRAHLPGGRPGAGRQSGRCHLRWPRPCWLWRAKRWPTSNSMPTRAAPWSPCAHFVAA